MKKYICAFLIILSSLILVSFAEPSLDVGSVKSMPSIFVQYPQDYYMQNVGQSFWFQVEVRADIADEVTYQWYYRDSPSQSWKKSTLSTATTNRLSGSTNEQMINRDYYVQVTYNGNVYRSNYVKCYVLSDMFELDVYQKDVVLLLSIVTFTFIGFFTMWVIKNAKHN